MRINDFRCVGADRPSARRVRIARVEATTEALVLRLGACKGCIPEL